MLIFRAFAYQVRRILEALMVLLRFVTLMVQKVEPEVSGKSSVAVIRPGADPRTVKHVFVITDY